MALLLHLLLFALALAALHAGMSWRRPLPLARFCAAVAGANVVIGLAVWLPTLSGQAQRSWTTLWWAPVLAFGLFASGGAAAVLWLGVVRGLAWLIERRIARRRGEPAQPVARR